MSKSGGGAKDMTPPPPPPASYTTAEVHIIISCSNPYSRQDRTKVVTRRSKPNHGYIMALHIFLSHPCP